MKAAEAYSVAPPVIRERAATLSLEEDDIVATVAVGVVPEAPVVTRPSAPPPLPARASRASSVPPPPHSEVRALSPSAKRPSSGSQKSVAPSAIVIPPDAPIPMEAAPVPPLVTSTVATSVAPPPPASFATPIVSAADPSRPSSLLDPTDLLFDSIYDMQFAETPWQAADVCAAALASALRAKAVVIHTHDLVRREIRTIAAQGFGASDLLGSYADSENDFVASAVLSNGKPLTMRFDGELPRLAPERLTIVGAKRSLVAVPALSWKRCVAVIEVIDADDRLVGRVPDAAAYVADHLAAFLMRQAA